MTVKLFDCKNECSCKNRWFQTLLQTLV